MSKIPLGELAGAIGARLEGDPAFVVTGVASLEQAGPEDLSFLANPRYEAAALASRAGALIAGVDVVLIGAGIPSQIPDVLTKLSAWQPMGDECGCSTLISRRVSTTSTTTPSWARSNAG